MDEKRQRSVYYNGAEGQVHEVLDSRQRQSCCYRFRQFFCGDYSHPFTAAFAILISVTKLLIFQFKLTSSPQIWGIIVAIVQFYLIKNVFGRKLAGLRWGTTVNTQGLLSWRFEGWVEDRDKLQFWQELVFWGLMVGELVYFTLSLFLGISNLLQIGWTAGHLGLLLTNLVLFYTALKYRHQRLFQILDVKGYQFLSPHKDYSIVVVAS